MSGSIPDLMMDKFERHIATCEECLCASTTEVMCEVGRQIWGERRLMMTRELAPEEKGQEK